MNFNRVLVILGHVMIWCFALDKLVALLLINRMQFGSAGFSEYSIFANKSLFIAWHVWGIIMAAVTSYAIWKKHRLLFLIGIFLVLVIQFYPWFTSSKDTPTPATTETVQDSTR